MKKNYKYGLMKVAAVPGDSVRYVPAKPVGVITAPHPIKGSNARLISVKGDRGYVEVSSPSSSRAGADSGGAVGVTISVPITSGGRLKVE